MGIDGRQYLEIRGPKEKIDELENLEFKIKGINKECDILADRFFGKENIEIKLRDPKYIVISFEYRNDNINQYFVALLNKYPMCWIKNDYSTENGYCGIWIGRFIKGKPYIQEIEWEELTLEEQCMGEDFSIS